MEPGKNLAAIDLGTNSFHIIIVKIRDNLTFEPITKEKESVRLGSGAGSSDVITPDAMERGLECLKRFKTLSQRNNAEIRAIATSALREAKNRNDFIERAKKQLGINIEVVSGYEEARLIYFGILQGSPVFDKKIMMVDIGGGSTEILVGQKGDILFSQSFKLGAIRLTDKFFLGDPLSPQDITQCRYYAEGMISPYKKEIERLQPEMIIGSSGTIQALAQMIHASESSEEMRTFHSYQIKSAELKKIRSQINAADTLKKRTKLPGLDARRADIITAGSIILEEVFQQFQVKTMSVSEYALREGIIYDTLRKQKNRSENEGPRLDNIRMKAVSNVSNTFPVEKKHTLHVKNLALKIFDQLLKLHGLSSEEREYLEAAATLHEVGLSISHSSHHKHSYYIIRNSEAMVGFNFSELEIIALVARYHRKSPPKTKHIEFSKISEEHQLLVKKLSSILRIADGLDRNHQGNIEDVRCEVQEGVVLFKATPAKGVDPHLELWSAQQKKDLFEDVFKVKSVFTS